MSSRTPNPPSRLDQSSDRSGALPPSTGFHAHPPATSRQPQSNGQLSTVQQFRRLQADAKENETAPGLPLVREVQAMLKERSRKRFADTVRYMHLNRRIKPPAPISLQELEEHPLLKRTRGARSSAGNAEAAEDGQVEYGKVEEEEEGEGGEAMPFIVDPVGRRDLKAALDHEIYLTDLRVTNRRIRLPHTDEEEEESGEPSHSTALVATRTKSPEIKTYASTSSISAYPALGLGSSGSEADKLNALTVSLGQSSVEFAQSAVFDGPSESLVPHLPLLSFKRGQGEGFGGAQSARSVAKVRFTGDGEDGEGARHKPHAETLTARGLRDRSPSRRQSTVFHLTDSGIIVNESHGRNLAELDSSSESLTVSRRGSLSKKGGASSMSLARLRGSLQGADYEPKLTPEDFLRLKSEKKHAQTYQRGLFHPPEAEPILEHTAATTRRFLIGLKLRSHEFNEQSIYEIQRARHAQQTFHQKKAEVFSEMLQDESLFTAPVAKILTSARVEVARTARAKDEADRLNVYYDHVTELKKKAFQLFVNSDDVKTALRFLTSVQEIIKRRDGLQDMTDFDAVTKEHFSSESFLLFTTDEFLTEVAPMFGVDSATYRHWIDGLRRRYEDRDMVSVFRSVEQKMGKDVSVEAKFRLTIIAAKNLVILPTATTKPPVFVKVACERHHYITKPCPASANPKWNDSYFLHVLNETSPVFLTTVIGNEALPPTQFAINQFPTGKTKFSLPTPSAQMPHAELVISVELFSIRHK
jgi:hypothetical protein